MSIVIDRSQGNSIQNLQVTTTKTKMNCKPASNPMIDKRIIHAGTVLPEFAPDSKVLKTYRLWFFIFIKNLFVSQVKFHFTTHIVNKESGEHKEIDDSRKFKQPVEILIGKKFKLEVWESIIQTMAIGEVAEFHVDKLVAYSYSYSYFYTARW